MKKVLTTPIKDEDIKKIHVGEIVYLTGTLVTCRDVPHRRLVESAMELPVDLTNLAIFHAGPIIAKNGEGWKMVSIGPTTSMRMEKFERQFIQKTGVKLIIGKGGMGPETVKACLACGALHAVFIGGCAVLAATLVEKIERVEWAELGMPEALWVLRVKNFGPLIVSIDTKGNNLFEINKATYNYRKKKIVADISREVKFIR